MHLTHIRTRQLLIDDEKFNISQARAGKAVSIETQSLATQQAVEASVEADKASSMRDRAEAGEHAILAGLRSRALVERSFQLNASLDNSTDAVRRSELITEEEHDVMDKVRYIMSGDGPTLHLFTLEYAFFGKQTTSVNISFTVTSFF